MRGHRNLNVVRREILPYAEREAATDSPAVVAIRAEESAQTVAARRFCVEVCWRL